MIPKIKKLNLFPSSNEMGNQRDMSLKISEFLASQSHLSPLPLSHYPILWNLDFCLRLYPLPSLVFEIVVVFFE